MNKITWEIKEHKQNNRIVRCEQTAVRASETGKLKEKYF